MSQKENLREALGRSSTLNLIRTMINRRGFSGDHDTLEEIASEVCTIMLENEEYYEQEFKYGLRTYIYQVITRAFERFARRPDALNGDLLFLDTVVPQGEDEEHLTMHDLLSQDDSLVDTKRFITQPGVPERMTYYLSQLPDQQADVFALKTVYGHTHREISDLLGVSEAYSKQLYTDAKRTLIVFRDSERAHEALMEIGNISGRVISNNESSAGVWADWSWQESHAQPGPVYVYSEDEITDYSHERGLPLDLTL